MFVLMTSDPRLAPALAALGAARAKLAELSTGVDRRVAPNEVKAVIEMADKAIGGEA